MVNLVGTSTPTEPGVSGSSSSSFAGVRGSNTSTGVGVRGFADHNDGIRGNSADGGAGVRGLSTGPNHNGVVGESHNSGNGVLGVAERGTGVYAISRNVGHGVYAISEHGDGGEIKNGVNGLVASGAGVMGVSSSVSVLGLVNPGGWHPELGLPDAHFSIGVCGAFQSGFPDFPGRQAPLPWDVPYVRKRTGDFPHIGVFVMANAGLVGVTPFKNGYGLIVANTEGGRAAAFQGDVEIEGNIHLSGNLLTGGRDCAECFAVADGRIAAPGTVVVADDGGSVFPCHAAYDRAVVGVVSGAGEERPGMILGGSRNDARESAAVALIGRVVCKVDAQYGAIAVGDPLTTSPTTGHAMLARDAKLAFGSIIGKALQPLTEGRGEIAMLVTLQ